MKTIYILWLRQLKRYIRSKSRIFGSLVQPLLFLLSLGYGLGHVVSGGQGNYINFLTPGIIGMGIIFASIFNGTEIIWDRQFGFLKETLVAPVSRINIMIGRTLGGATVATTQGLIVLILSFFLGFHPTNYFGIIPMIFLMFITAILFTAIGTAIGSLMSDMQGFQLVINFLVMPLFFLSGALFPLEGLPKVLSVIATLDPLSYGVDSFRAVLINTTYYGLGIDVMVLSIVAILFVTLGGYFFSKIEV